MGPSLAWDVGVGNDVTDRRGAASDCAVGLVDRRSSALGSWGGLRIGPSQKAPLVAASTRLACRLDTSHGTSRKAWTNGGKPRTAARSCLTCKLLLS